MTITIEVPDELAARLSDAGILAPDASRYAVTALEEVADHEEIRVWWDRLSEPDRDAERSRTAQSLASLNESGSNSAGEVYARIRAKHSSGSGA